MIDRDELINSWEIFRDKMISALTGKGKQIMLDKEKVIKVFDDAKELVWLEDDEYTVGYNAGIEAGKNIALALLKEQEPVKPILSVKDRCYYCGNCDETEVKTYDHYCPRCGRELKWQ